MSGNTLTTVASQYRLSVNSQMAYGYLQGSFVTLSDTLFSHKLCIYIGCCHMQDASPEAIMPAEKSADLILDRVNSMRQTGQPLGLVDHSFLPAVRKDHHGSVITLHFSKNRQGRTGLTRFITEVLPQLTPYTAPLQCACCGAHTLGQGYPVRISAGTIVPMHAACLHRLQPRRQPRQAIKQLIFPAIGALLGAALSVLLMYYGLSPVFALLPVPVLTFAARRLFCRKESEVQILPVSLLSVLAILLAYIASNLILFHQQYQNMGDVVASMMRESLYLRISIKGLFTDIPRLSQHLLPSALLALILTAVFAPKTTRPKAMPGRA